MSLSVLEGHAPIVAFSNAIFRICGPLCGPSASKNMAKAQNFKLCTLVIHVNISIRMTNYPSKGPVRSYVTKFKFWGPNHISGMTEATVVKFCTHVSRFEMITYPLVGMVVVT